MQNTRLPEVFGGLALLLGLYGLLRLALWAIFTRFLKDVDERGDYECDGDCLKGGQCITKDHK